MSSGLEFAGRVALITGGADGMGWAAAELLARRGASVSICDTNAELGRRRVTEHEALGAPARFIATDVGDPVQCEAAVAATEAAFGRLDLAFNNAGYPGDAWIGHRYPQEVGLVR